MKKTLLFLSTILVLIALTVSVSVFASEEDVIHSGKWGNLKWTLTTTGELTISGNGDMNDFVKKNSISDMGGWLEYSYSIKDVVIEDGVTSIGDYAFYYCDKLTRITIPDSVTSIGDYAFYYCTKLTRITIPDSVASIGTAVCGNCTALKSINIPDGVTSIGDRAFYCCSDLTSIAIPDGITSIGDSAFYACKDLTSITIPDGVTSIGDHAFCGCTHITSITIPDSVTSIGNYAFSSCTNLKSVFVSDLESWLNISFGNASSYPNSGLTELFFINDVGDVISKLEIPDSVTSIGDYAFYNCTKLTTITIPNSVTSIGDYAFFYCTNLMEVYINSQIIASQLTSSTVCGRLLLNNETVLINKSITEIPEYISTTYSYTEPITYEGVDYVSYSLQHAHDWEDCSASNIPCGESGFNGFVCTTCGVFKGNTVTADHDYENGVCTACKKLNVALRGRNITLGGIIGMNFYFEIDPAVVNADSYVVFTLESGREVRIPVSQGIQDTASIPGTVLYKFSCPVYSTEMSDTIVAKVVMGENESEVYERTVVSYAIALLNGNYADEDKALIKAMLNYGAYAQIEFDHNTDNLANADLDAADKVLSSDITADKFATALESSNLENIGKYAGATLLLGSETTLKAYFAPASGVNASDVTFTMNGNELTATTETMGSTTYAVVYIENISADKLDDVFTITATLGENSGTFQCSAFKYCYNVLNAATGTYSEDLINVLKAMYTYNQATIAYLNK